MSTFYGGSCCDKANTNKTSEALQFLIHVLSPRHVYSRMRQASSAVDDSNNKSIIVKSMPFHQTIDHVIIKPLGFPEDEARAD